MTDILSKFDRLKPFDLAPKSLNYRGDLSLLDEPIVSIVGSRAMSPYTKAAVAKISSSLAAAGVVISSGGAIGVDIAAAAAAYPRTIAILPSGLDKYYPPSNAKLLSQIAANGGLLLSEYENLHHPQKYDFLHRNRLVVACSSALIIAQAEYKSGSLNSASWAQKLGIPIYVLAQPLDASSGSLSLVEKSQAKLIFDLEHFLAQIKNELSLQAAKKHPETLAQDDELLAFIGAGCSFDEAFSRFGEKLYDYELDGLIQIDGVFVRLA